MKLIFATLLLLLFLNCESRPDYLSSVPHRNIIRFDGDSTEPIHVVNYSSLKRLPGVLKDLLVVLKESAFIHEQLLDEKGVDIILQDVVWKRFDTVAAVTY